MNSINTAMLFAAGLGTRLKPFTNNHPKALALVNGKSLLERNVLYLQEFGIINVVVNVHHFANQIIEAIQQNNGWGSNIIVSDEQDEVLETGGGLVKAKKHLQTQQNFVVMNVDILTNLNLNNVIQQHQKTNALATLAVSQRETARYFLFNQNMELSGWQNKNTGEVKPYSLTNITPLSPFAFSGLHVINHSIFNHIQQQGKFSMVDVYLSLMNQHKIIGYNHTGSLLIDVGKPESIIKAEQYFK
jgi:NDP-sugar pyrophosphorylase family protein